MDQLSPTSKAARLCCWYRIALVVLCLTACAQSTPPLEPSRVASPAVTVRPTPTATAGSVPTPVPQNLVICTTEPEAVSPFVTSQSGSDVLALFYEEPIERVGYAWQARLVERVPTAASGDVVTQAIQLTDGMRYVDGLGSVLTYAGPAEMALPQLVVTFTLRSGLKWSDGEPVSAQDALLGYHLAQSSSAGRWRQLAERTSRFVAVGDRVLRWEGLPGYLSTDYPGFIFPLQPAHRWHGQALEAILGDRTPPATGPFKIVAWESGREVRLERNPYYAGSAPTLETVTVRFPQVGYSQWIALLAEGTCDIVLPDPAMLVDWRSWAAAGAQGFATLWATAAPVMLRLDLNLAPEGEVTALSDTQVRLAIGHCIDRQRLVEALPNEMVAPADGFIPPGHPAYERGVASLAYDRASGEALLAQAGWYDEDGDGLREAHGVSGIADGEVLSLTLHMAPQYVVEAAYISADLEACGIGTLPQPTEARLLYAADAVSPLSGRSFELALFGWQADLPAVCGAWRQDRIPGPSNDWAGENFSGYGSDAYDAACNRALTAVDRDAQIVDLRTAQALLHQSASTLFLAWRPFWFVARPSIEGLQPDASAYGTLWNIEALRIGAP